MLSPLLACPLLFESLALSLGACLTRAMPATVLHGPVEHAEGIRQIALRAVAPVTHCNDLKGDQPDPSLC